MHTRTRLGCLVAAAILGLPLTASAQQAGELILYRDVGFRGESYTLRGPEEHVALGWMVRSWQAAPGEAWVVCGRDAYQQPCSRVVGSDRSVQRMVASAKPDTVAAPQAVTLEESGGGGQSLRGVGAEFFTAPADDGGNRLAACDPGSPACGSNDAADAFCRAQGWNRAAYQRQETEGGRSWLADVLCVKN